MNFKLDYNRMLFLDAEDLAEAGIKEAYQSMVRVLGQYVSEPSEVQEVVDNNAPSYVVECAGLEYLIYSPALSELCSFFHSLRTSQANRLNGCWSKHHRGAAGAAITETTSAEGCSSS